MTLEPPALMVLLERRVPKVMLGLQDLKVLMGNLALLAQMLIWII